MRLVVTRPEPDATRTGRALIALGHVAILSPMLEVIDTPLPPIPAGPYQAVLVTSRNAVRALARRPDLAILVPLPVLAVGDQTALEARRAGLRRARSAGGAIGDLIALAKVELQPAAGRLLYLAGDAQAGDLAGRLAMLGFAVQTCVLYRMEARKQLSRVASEGLRSGYVDGVLLYSQRSAEAFAAALRADGLAPLAASVSSYCLSGAVAEPLTGVTRGPVRLALRPDQISLFACLDPVSPGGAVDQALS